MKYESNLLLYINYFIIFDKKETNLLLIERLIKPSFKNKISETKFTF